MDDSARGIATASFTLQSSLLQALVRKRCANYSRCEIEAVHI